MGFGKVGFSVFVKALLVFEFLYFVWMFVV